MLRTLVVLVLVALLPLRAVAAVASGFCAMGHQEQAGAGHAAHGHEPGARVHHGDGEDRPAKPAAPSCSICVEHCSSAAFVPSFAPLFAAPAISQASAVSAAHAAPAFFPDHLDRPPLALLR
jgi:hypothetical protein